MCHSNHRGCPLEMAWERAIAFPMSKSWTKLELAYFAGIIDGEGCIYLGRRISPNGKKIYFRVLLTVANTDVRLIDWISSRFVGHRDVKKKRSSPAHKPLYRWQLEGPRVQPVLEAVLPYLLLKREQALCALEVRKTILLGNNKITITPEMFAVRESLVSRMHELNRRGVAV